MHKTILTAWPLFFGASMIMFGNGLQTTLLGVRAAIEGFPTYSTGIIMSMYFVGTMLGSHFVPKLIRGVGHIRVFAALSAIASTTVLFHALFISEPVWGLVRIVTGFSYAGLYIVIESWLNNAATNQTRGKMMATYLVVLYTSMAAGQYLLTMADPSGTSLFITSSILVTIAVLPISLSSRPAPQFSAPVKVSIKELYKSSPLGVYATFASGMASATLFSVGPIYAAQAGLSLAQISTFMAAAIISGVLMQFPIGWCSDKFDRRRVLILVAASTSISCLLAMLLAPISPYALFLGMFLIGGTALTIYGLSTAHTNDHLTPVQIVAASASLIMVNGMGSIIGPTLSTSLMNLVAPWMFFATLACIYASIAAFGIYRTMKRPPVGVDRQTHFVPQTNPSSIAIMQQATEQSQETLNELKKHDNLS